MGAAVVEVLNSHPEHQLDSSARRGKALERELIEALTGNSAVGNRRRRAQHLGRAVAGAPSTPAMGDCGLERVWHEIEETPRAVRTAEGFAWIDEQDPRVVRQARVEQGHRERESREPRARNDHVGVEGGPHLRLSHAKLLPRWPNLPLIATKQDDAVGNTEST